jgi:S-adenosylmethionine-dependent methyltransferase
MTDRNFDDLAERFESRIHHGLKGKIRRAVIWRDLLKHAMTNEKPLRILDIGGGLGHFSIELAKLGHELVYNDISLNMMEKAKAYADKEKLTQQITWNNMPYQDILTSGDDKNFDLILCHAVIEWLSTPSELIPALKKMLKPAGLLSLCYYNPAGLVYRNLICGNFHYLDNLDTTNCLQDQSQSLPTDTGSLTPQNPCSIEQVEQWLAQSNFANQSTSGIRVFSDYILQKRGGNQSEEETMQAEITYSTKEPYKRLGRYIHTIAKLQ